MVDGLQQLPVEDKKQLLKKLKNAVAGGGNIADNGNIEVQGEHADTVRCPARVPRLASLEISLCRGC